MITDQKTIDGLKELNYTQVYEQGFEKGRQFERDKVLELRDELYEELPTGDLDAFNLIKIIKNHINKLDELQSINQTNSSENKI